MPITQVNAADSPNTGRGKWNANDVELDARVSDLEGGLSGFPAIPDDVTLEISGGELRIKPAGVGNTQMGAAAVDIANITTELSNFIASQGVTVDNVTLQESGGVISIKPDGIDLSRLADDVLQSIQNNPAPDNTSINKNEASQLQIAPAGVTVPTLAADVLALIESSGGGGYEPDDVTIELTELDKLQIKAAGVNLSHLGSDVTDLINGAYEVLSVVEYGADPTGVASSSQAFQDTFDAAGGSGKAIVLVPPGTYLAKCLTVSGGTWIMAAGATIKIGGTPPESAGAGTWLIESSADNIVIDGGTWQGELVSDYAEQSEGTIFRFIDADFLRICGAIIEKSRQHGVHFSGCQYTKIEDVIIRDIAGAAVNYEGGSGHRVRATQFLTVRNALRAVTKAGISDFTNAVFEGNTVRAFAHAVSFKACRRFRIINNDFEPATAGAENGNNDAVITNAALTSTPVTSEFSGFLFQNNQVKNYNAAGATTVNLNAAFTTRADIRFDGNIFDACGSIQTQVPLKFIGNRVKNSAVTSFYAILMLAPASPADASVFAYNEIENTVATAALFAAGKGAMTFLGNNIKGNVTAFGEAGTTFNGNVVVGDVEISNSSYAGGVFGNYIKGSVTIGNHHSVTGNVFEVEGSKKVSVSSATSVQVTSNKFFGDATLALSMNTTKCVVELNIFEDVVTGIELAAPSSENHVKRNYFRGIVTAVDDNGTDNVVADNIIFDMLAWDEVFKIQAEDAQADDRFGFSTAIDGDYAIVGAPREDAGGSNAGAAYIFERDGGGTWSQAQKLVASDAEASDEFGETVAISGTYAIVGARFEATGGASAGAAYIFERDGGGTWNQVAKIQSTDIEAGDQFGISVGINGNRAIIGAYEEDTGATNVGAAYIFERDGGGTWSQVAKIQATDKEENDRFGRSVAISGDRAIVGAYLEDAGGDDAGAAYIFERDGGGTWNQVAKLQSSDIQLGDQFGIAVAIAGDYAVVGASFEDTGGSNAGAAYIFERDGGGTWNQVAKIQSSDIEAGDQFGGSVAINGDRAIIGALAEGAGGSFAGAAYIFQRDGGGTWNQVTKIVASDAQASDFFGGSVAINGDRAIIGAYGEDTGGSSAGSAYIYEYS